MDEFLQRVTHELWRDISALGGFLFYGFLAVFVLLLGHQELFWKLTVGVIILLVIVVITRSFYFKQRPQKQLYYSYLEKLDASAFPSFHTARVTFLALLLSQAFRHNMLSLFLLALVILIGVSRLQLKKHDGWDVLGGAVAGGLAFVVTLLIF